MDLTTGLRNRFDVTTADLPSRDFARILLIKLSAVGDVVQTIPLFNKLRRRYPAARIDWPPAMLSRRAARSRRYG